MFSDQPTKQTKPQLPCPFFSFHPVVQFNLFWVLKQSESEHILVKTHLNLNWTSPKYPLWKIQPPGALFKSILQLFLSKLSPIFSDESTKIGHFENSKSISKVKPIKFICILQEDFYFFYQGKNLSNKGSRMNFQMFRL